MQSDWICRGCDCIYQVPDETRRMLAASGFAWPHLSIAATSVFVEEFRLAIMHPIDSLPILKPAVSWAEGGWPPLAVKISIMASSQKYSKHLCTYLIGHLPPCVVFVNFLGCPRPSAAQTLRPNPNPYPPDGPAKPPAREATAAHGEHKTECRSGKREGG